MFQKETHRKNIETNHDSWWWNEDEILQYDINRDAAKISALSSRKNVKYEFVTG